MKRKVVNLSLSVTCCIAVMLLMILPIGPFIDGLWVLQPWGGFFMLAVEFNNSILTLFLLLGRFGYGT